MMGEPTQHVIDAAMVSALEFIISKCKEQRQSIGANLDYDYDVELMTRQEGFRGALAWVEGVCCEEINRIRKVVL